MADDIQAFERDYWAPDREEVLNRMRNPQQQQQTLQNQVQPFQDPGQQGGQVQQQGAWQSGGQDPQKIPAQQGGGGPFDRNAFRDSWMGSGVNTVQGMNDWLQSSGWGSRGVTAGGSKGDQLFLPSGEIIDGILAAGLGGGVAGPQWTGRGSMINGQYVPQGGSASGSNASGASSGSSFSSSTSGYNTGDPRYNQLMDLLIKRSQQSLAVNRNDPTIRAQADPYAANVERARRDYVADAAEDAGPVANIRGEKRLASERAGQASGLFESQLIGREILARRDEISQALQQWGGMLSQEQQLALQKELSYLDDATRRYGIDTQARTAADQIGLGYGQLGLDRDRLGLDIGRAEADNWWRSQQF
jgi:hypothetical protein